MSTQVSNREAALLDMGLNPDEFTESKIDPALFTLAAWPNDFLDVEYPCVPCAMCGHLCRWIVGFKHLPSGETIYVGEDCANYLDSENIVQKQMKMFKTKVANQKEEERKQAEFNARREQMLAEYPDVIQFLLAEEASGKLSGFMFDMVYAYNKFGSLTEKQALAVRKIKMQRDEFEARKAAEKPAVPLLGGKRLCEGEVVTTKWQDNPYGASVKKMLVKLLDGNKVWGTVPKSILSVRVGEKVSFLANVIISTDDENFGFYKNPSKAVIEHD